MHTECRQCFCSKSFYFCIYIVRIRGFFKQFYIFLMVSIHHFHILFIELSTR